MNSNKSNFIIPDCEVTFVDDEGKEVSEPTAPTIEATDRNAENKSPGENLRENRSESVLSEKGDRGYESSGNQSGRRYSDSYNVGPSGMLLDDKRGFLFPSYGALPRNPGSSQDEKSPLLDSGSGYVSTAAYSSLHSSMETIPRHGLNYRDDASQVSETREKEKKQPFFKRFKFQLNILKVSVLVGITIFCVVTLIFIQEKERSFKNIAVKKGEPVYVELSSKLTKSLPVLRIEALGAFLPEKYLNISPYHVWFTVVQLGKNGSVTAVRDPWEVPHAPVELSQKFGLIELEHTFAFSREELSVQNVYTLRVTTDETDHIPITLSVSTFAEILQDGLIMAGVVLLGLYILLVFDLVHRTLASIIAATVAIAFLALTQDRPTLEKVISWLDVETLSLLFGMMILVAILCETGFFDYLAVLAYRLAKGRFWSLLTTLCLFTAVVSAFLDNVTTILLMTPVTIRLCEVMNLDPRKILIALVIFSNIGGASTPVGDPPNVIIISNKDVIEAGIGFAGFTFHCMPGIVLCTIGAMIYIRIVYRDVNCFRFTDPPEVEEMKHEIELWKKASNSLSGYSRDENTIKLILKKKVRTMKKTLRKKLYDIKPSDADYKANLEELTNKYKIHNMPLFIKTASVLSIVIIMFFLHSIPDLNLSLGWIALLGAIILLILADFDELESVISRVEWPTLIFFAALFVVMEALSELQLLAYIGNLTESWIMAIPPDSRLWVSILLILWVSAIASSFIDNIPFTTIMVQIVVALGKNEELGLPLVPIIYALAFGACLGGNGTLIGASANVVCAGVAEQHGYRFTFVDFIKMGFPVMILTTIISSGYLIVCHVVLEWNT